jgi:DNA polymerase III subunit delta'
MKSETPVFDPIRPSVQEWQRNLVNQFVELKQQQRLPHAILIELRTAVDSRSFGWHLVSALFCQSENQDKPCGQCQSCQLMLANNYPDLTFTTLVENDKTHKLNKDIKIDQIRRLIHQFTLTRNLQSGKIALIYPAEKLNKSSANSLLKTLEEPSSGSTLILLTHNAGRLPVTIRSRCQKWVVENPNEKLATEWLIQQDVPSEQVAEYLSLARKDVQLALQLFQQGLKQQQDHFSILLNKYILNQMDIVSMVKSIKITENEKLRLVLKTELQNMIYNLLQNELTKALKQKLSGLIGLLSKIDSTLQTEDNNLNLLLQLEDVLISLKQIVK